MSYRRTVILFFLMIAAAAPVSAQMLTDTLSSPAYASGGAGVASTETPFSDRFNPALSAAKQRLTVEASYFALPGLSTGGLGHAANLGAALPTKWAVFSASGSFLTADFPDFKPGTLGRLTLGASKDVYDDLYVGANLDFTAGTGNGVNTWGLGAGFGFLHLLGNLGPLQDFRWGAAFRNLGTYYLAQNGTAVPPPFTPAVGAEFTVLKTKDLVWKVRPDLSFPSFQDVNLAVGTSLGVQDFLTFDLGVKLDLRDLAAGTAPALPLSLGVRMKFANALQTGQDDSHRSEVNVLTAAQPLPGGVWAFGTGVNIPVGVKDTNAPEVKLESKAWYISPNNDGIQDTLILPLAITDERYVDGYTLEISDLGGKTVRKIQNKVVRPDTPGLDTFWKRLTFEKQGVPVPPTLVWNGLKDDGSLAADGTYKLALTAWDDNGNKRTVDGGTVVVKTAPPLLSLSLPETEFNPSGPRNTLTLTQSGSVEDQWNAVVKDAQGKPVRTFTWPRSAPPAAVWDGKADDGRPVPDGVYSYELWATDRAGNTSRAKASNIIVNSVPTPLDLNLSRSAFSPLGNGVKTLSFIPKAGTPAGVAVWKLDVTDAKGTPRRHFEGKGGVPREVVFDGKDDAQANLEEGIYQGVLTLEYSNGNTPKAVSAPLTLKNTPPQAEVKVAQPVFSPGSSEGRSILTFQQTTTEEDTWTGKIEDSQGRLVRQVSWPGKADATYLWDGRGSDGQIESDGTYRYTLTATDKAGNTGVSPAVEITIDTQKRTVFLSTDRSAFTPSAQPAGKIHLLPQIKGSEGLVSWKLTVEDGMGKAVRTWDSRGPLPGQVEWDGKDDGGKPQDDGNYRARLSLSFANGLTPAAQSNPFRLKLDLPDASLKSSQLVFNPLAGSLKPTVKIDQRTTPENEWHGRILDKDKNPVRTWAWKNTAPNLEWNGADEKGNRAPDGTYTYELTTTDEAGNTVTKTLPGITLDTRPTAVFLTVGTDGFSPNGDGITDTQTFTTKASLADGAASWKLEMTHEKLGVQKTFQGTGLPPAQIVWDGLNDVKSTAEDGRYTARLQVLYTKGDAPETRSAAFVLQAKPPRTEITLDGLPFSPDNDGVNDELGIGIALTTYAPVETWDLKIQDPEGNLFKSFTGKGMPSPKLTWDGRSDTGELVQSASDYTLVFTVADSLGNKGSVKKTVPVDVLVIKDGDKLRIIIPSITFVQDKSDFLNVESEKAAKNVAVLKRLAEIFTKYSKYKIVIEGHAVMVNWNDPVLGKKEQNEELLPLSKARAEAVKSFLAGLGIDAGRISTVGVGGARPLVPFGDLTNRWKNRRVEFLLVRD